MTSIPEASGPSGCERASKFQIDTEANSWENTWPDEGFYSWSRFCDANYTNEDRRPGPPGTHRPEDLWNREQ